MEQEVKTRIAERRFLVWEKYGLQILYYMVKKLLEGGHMTSRREFREMTRQVGFELAVALLWGRLPKGLLKKLNFQLLFEIQEQAQGEVRGSILQRMIDVGSFWDWCRLCERGKLTETATTRMTKLGSFQDWLAVLARVEQRKEGFIGREWVLNQAMLQTQSILDLAMLWSQLDSGDEAVEMEIERKLQARTGTFDTWLAVARAHGENRAVMDFALQKMEGLAETIKQLAIIHRLARIHTGNADIAARAFEKLQEKVNP